MSAPFLVSVLLLWGIEGARAQAPVVDYPEPNFAPCYVAYLKCHRGCQDVWTDSNGDKLKGIADAYREALARCNNLYWWYKDSCQKFARTTFERAIEDGYDRCDAICAIDRQACMDVQYSYIYQGPLIQPESADPTR